MPLYTPPGGWCLTPQGNLTGIAAAQLYFGGAPIFNLIGGIMTTVLRGHGVTTQEIQRAITNAIDASKLPWSQELDEFTEFATALWQPSAYVITQQFNTTNAIGQAMLRLKRTDLPLIQLQAANEAQMAQNYAVSYARDIYNTVEHGLTVGLHETLASSEYYAKTLAEQVAKYATELTGAESYHRIVGDMQVTANSRARERIVLNWADSAINDIATYSETAIRTLGEQLVTTQRWAATQIAQTRVQASTDAATAANQATANGNAAVQTQLQPVWAGTAESANQAIPKLKALTPTGTATLSPVSTITPATPALALAGVMQMIKPLLKNANDCSLPNCKEKNTVGKKLKTIGTLFETGIMLAFMLEIIEKPTDTAKAVQSVGHQLIDTVTSLFTSVIPSSKPSTLTTS